MIKYEGINYINYNKNPNQIIHFLRAAYISYHKYLNEMELNTFHYWMRCFCAATNGKIYGHSNEKI